MEAKKYDEIVKGLLEALDLDDADVTKVTVEPHKITVNMWGSEDEDGYVTFAECDYYDHVIDREAPKANAVTVNVSAPVGTSPAALGKEIVKHLQAYEQVHGKKWRQ